MSDDIPPPVPRWRAGAVAFAGIAGAGAVAAGAWAAHGFGGLPDARAAALVETASRYAIWHALAILVCAFIPLAGMARRLLDFAVLAFAIGIAGFCGGLCLSAFGRPVPALAPAGGLAFIAGWLLAAAAGIAMLVRKHGS